MLRLQSPPWANTPRALRACNVQTFTIQSPIRQFSYCAALSENQWMSGKKTKTKNTARAEFVDRNSNIWVDWCDSSSGTCCPINKLLRTTPSYLLHFLHASVLTWPSTAHSTPKESAASLVSSGESVRLCRTFFIFLPIQNFVLFWWSKQLLA